MIARIKSIIKLTIVSLLVTMVPKALALSPVGNFSAEMQRAKAGINQEFLAAKFHLPDGVNGGAEDYLLRPGGDTSATGDDLTAITTVTDVGYTNPRPYNGNQPVIIDNDKNGKYTDIADIFIDNGQTGDQAGSIEPGLAEGSILPQVPVDLIKRETGDGILWRDLDDNDRFDNGEPVYRGNPIVGVTTGIDIGGGLYVYRDFNGDTAPTEGEDIFLSSKSLVVIPGIGMGTYYASRSDTVVYGEQVAAGTDLNSDWDADIKFTGATLSSSSDIYRDSVDPGASTVHRTLDEIKALTFENLGSANSSDLEYLNVYGDPDRSVLLGQANWDGVNSWDLVGPSNALIPGGGRDLYVFAKTSSSPTDGRTIDLTIPGLFDQDPTGQWSAGDGGFFVRSNNDGPTGGGVFDGNESNFITIDAIPPTVSLTSPADGSAVNDSEPVLTYAVSGEAGIQVYADNVPVGTTNGGKLIPLIDGEHTVVVEARDDANNKTSVSATFVIDTVAPAPGLSVSPNGQQVGPGDTLVFAGQTQAGATVTLEVFTPVVTRSTVADSLGFWRIEVSAAEVGAGAHTAFVTIRDRAGNLARYQVASFRVKTALEAALSPVVSAITGAESAIPEVKAAEPQGEIKAAEAQAAGRNWATVITAIAIIIIAAGLGTAGFYGYEWWLTRRTEEVESKPARRGRPKKEDTDLRW